MRQSNAPELWIKNFPEPCAESHKYKRGQVFVMGGAEMTGAACLAADAAARTGAGLVTIYTPKQGFGSKYKYGDCQAIYKSYRPYIMAKPIGNLHYAIQENSRKGNVCSVIGPGLGNKNYKLIRKEILKCLGTGMPMIIDADGIDAFEGQERALFESLHKNVVLTPHHGEFKRVFKDISGNKGLSSLEKAGIAAQKSGAIIVLKGYETYITNNKTCTINDNASAYLATAGAGDVLSGIIAGLIAQGMPPYNAACCGVWIHGKTSEICGAGMVSADIIEKIPKVLKEMLGIKEKVG